MPNLAQITIAGHIGKDAELKYTQAGDAVASFSVAVNSRRNDDETIWYRVSIWRKYAEILAPLLKKGKVVTVIGDFQPRQYDANDGSRAWSFDIQGNTVIVAGDNNNQQDNEQYEGMGTDTEDIPF